MGVGWGQVPDSTQRPKIDPVGTAVAVDSDAGVPPSPATERLCRHLAGEVERLTNHCLAQEVELIGLRPLVERNRELTDLCEQLNRKIANLNRSNR